MDPLAIASVLSGLLGPLMGGRQSAQNSASMVPLLNSYAAANTQATQARNAASQRMFGFQIMPEAPNPNQPADSRQEAMMQLLGMFNPQFANLGNWYNANQGLFPGMSGLFGGGGSGGDSANKAGAAPNPGAGTPKSYQALIAAPAFNSATGSEKERMIRELMIAGGENPDARIGPAVVSPGAMRPPGGGNAANKSSIAGFGSGAGSGFGGGGGGGATGGFGSRWRNLAGALQGGNQAQGRIPWAPGTGLARIGQLMGNAGSAATGQGSGTGWQIGRGPANNIMNAIGNMGGGGGGAISSIMDFFRNQGNQGGDTSTPGGETPAVTPPTGYRDTVTPEQLSVLGPDWGNYAGREVEARRLGQGAMAGLDTDYSRLMGGYRERENAAGQLVNQGRADIGTAYNNLASRTSQDLLSRGMGGSSVTSSMNRGIERDKQAELRRSDIDFFGLTDSLARERLTADERLREQRRAAELGYFGQADSLARERLTAEERMLPPMQDPLQMLQVFAQMFGG